MSRITHSWCGLWLYHVRTASDDGLFFWLVALLLRLGSGIPEIEGAMEEMRPVRWWRVIPVKFIGGLGTLGAGMVLGREGPMVQMGATVGE